MSTPAKQWEELTNQSSLPGASGPAPQGANLPAPRLPGDAPQPKFSSKLPGFGPIHFALVNSFLVGKSAEELTDKVMDAIIAAAERFTDKLLANYPGYLPVDLGTKLPDNWKK